MPCPERPARWPDALGSPVVVTDGGRVQQGLRNEYEPYGQVLSGGIADRPGYTGHVKDALTGMDYMQQRYYDPMIGRFLSVDPVTANPRNGTNFNRYWYGNDNPYKFTDPDGRLPDWFKAMMGQPVDSSGTRREMSGAMAGAVNREVRGIQSTGQKIIDAAPKSAFVQVDAGARGGSPLLNGNAQYGVGVLLSPQGADMFRSQAANVGIAGDTTSLLNGQSSGGFVMGASAGPAFTFGLSNANGMQQFSGTSNEANVSIGPVSLTASSGGGNWTLSGSVGKGPSASVSVQPVETKPLKEK